MTEFNMIREKIISGTRLNEEDAIFLYHSPRLFEIGQLADIVNYRKNQNIVFYNINSHLNPTNICVMTCKFCSFSRKPGDEGAYAYSLDEILVKAENAISRGARELHMVGGLHPRWGLDYFAKMFSAIKARFPDVHIKALTAVEIDWLARKSRKSHSDVLLILKDAGLDSMPGGGAEIFHEDCREKITAKLSTEDWLKIHRTAHQMSIKTNCTMLYGHVETYEHRVFHLQQLRNLQDETHGFNCFIPLAFQPHHNEMGIDRFTFGADDLKTIAIARLYLDNFLQIKSYWVMLGQDIAQLALHFGANDMDGTVNDEKISNMAGGRAGIGMQQKSIKRLILKSQKNPQERDTLYHPLGAPETKDLTQEEQRTLLPLLQRAADREDLSSDELHLLAEKADLFSLSLTAQKIRSHYVSSEFASFGTSHELDILDAIENPGLEDASDITLDLANIAKLKSDFMVQDFFKAVSFLRDKKINLALAGFSAIWQLVQRQSISLATIFQELKELGVRMISSSVHENEGILTHREIIGLHRTAHANQLMTMAKVEINSPPAELFPLWKSFVERLIAFRDLQHNTHGLVGISVEPAADSWVTAQEYVRAVALTRIVCPNISHVVVPFQRIPTSREVHLSDGASQAFLRGQEKFAPLLLLAGADDFGILPDSSGVQIRIHEEISSVGLTARQRDLYFEKYSSKLGQLQKQLDLRHIPQQVMMGKNYELASYLTVDRVQGTQKNAAYH